MVITHMVLQILILTCGSAVAESHSQHILINYCANVCLKHNIGVNPVFLKYLKNVWTGN